MSKFTVVGYQVEALLEQRVRERYNMLKKEGAADIATTSRTHGPDFQRT
jgi:hypothetical protein